MRNKDKIVTRFLWLPTLLAYCNGKWNNELRWLETAKIRQRINIYGEWADICWED